MVEEGAADEDVGAEAELGSAGVELHADAKGSKSSGRAQDGAEGELVGRDAVGEHLGKQCQGVAVSAAAGERADGGRGRDDVPVRHSVEQVARE